MLHSVALEEIPLVNIFFFLKVFVGVCVLHSNLLGQKSSHTSHLSSFLCQTNILFGNSMLCQLHWDFPLSFCPLFNEKEEDAEAA